MKTHDFYIHVQYKALWKMIPIQDCDKMKLVLHIYVFDCFRILNAWSVGSGSLTRLKCHHNFTADHSG